MATLPPGRFTDPENPYEKAESEIAEYFKKEGKLPPLDLSGTEFEVPDRAPLLPPGLDEEGLRKFFESRKSYDERRLTKQDRPLPDDPAYD